MRPLVKPDDRPYILFRRIKNTGISPKPARPADPERGIKAKPAMSGETEIEWRKSLVSLHDSSPYVWVGKDWIIDRTSATCQPIGIGNMDKLPADYPKEWLAKLHECVSAIATHVASNQKLAETEKRLEQVEREFAARVAELEALKKNEGRSEAERPEQAERGGADAAALQKPSRKAGAASVSAAS